MACISKISSAISYNCDSGNIGIFSALLINKEDIASFTASESYISALTLKTGASAYKIDTVKRTLVMSEALKTNEAAPNAFTHSATMVLTSAIARTSAGSTPSASAFLSNLINPSANGSFVILAKVPSDEITAGAIVRAYGLYYGMSATSVERSTHDNGSWYTITLATPDRVIGEDALSMYLNAYDTLYAAAVG